MDREARQQPVANEGTDDSDYNITNYPKTCAPNDFAGQPPRNETDQHYDEETFVRYVHGGVLTPSPSDPGRRNTPLRRRFLKRPPLTVNPGHDSRHWLRS